MTRGPRYSLGSGRVISGQQDCLWIPSVITRKRVIIYSPPGADTANAGTDPSVEPALLSLLALLCDLGFLVVVGDFDGHAFGHDALLTEWETFRSTLLPTLLATLAGGSVVDTSKIIVGGHSQGVDDAARWAEQNPSKTVAVFSIAGATDLQGLYTGVYHASTGSDAGTLNQSQIAAAYGIAYPTALPASADPRANGGLMASIPTWIGCSAGDTTVTTGWGTDFKTAVGAKAEYHQISATSTHSDAEVTDAINAGLVSWLLRQAEN